MAGRMMRARLGRALRSVLLIVMAATLPRAVQAQQFQLVDVPVQVHGFASQAFTATDGNNFLTMNTSDGSFGFSDAGLNVSSQITSRLRAGVQVYTRDVGKLGNWGVSIDWGYADYRVADVLGVRGGKVKTAIGLYNDTQDVDFLHTWALLPQAVYPVDLRSDTIAHTGVDAYGDIGLKKAGTLRYTAYVGKKPHDLNDGFGYANVTNGTTLDSYGGTVRGGDLRWTTPLAGVMVGASFYDQKVHAEGIRVRRGITSDYTMRTKVDQTSAFYGEYQFRNLRVDGEYRRTWRVINQINQGGAPWSLRDMRDGFVSAAYRVSKWVELGTYHSRFIHDADDKVIAVEQNHVYDTAITTRVDLSRFWTVKIEGHFMDGYAKTSSGRGFYTTDNPQGLRAETRMLVVRTAVNF